MKKVLSILSMLVFVAGIAVAQTPAASTTAAPAKKEVKAPKKASAAKADTTQKAHLKHPKKKAAAKKAEAAK
jgi:hypothetical protein